MTIPTPKVTSSEEVMAIVRNDQGGLDDISYRVMVCNEGLKIFKSYYMNTDGDCFADGWSCACGTLRYQAFEYFMELVVNDICFGE